MFMLVHSLESRSRFRARFRSLIGFRFSSLIGFLGLGLLLPLVTTQGVAEDVPDVAKWTTERFLDEEAVVVLELDLEAIRPREVSEWAVATGISREPLPAPILSMHEMIRASLRAAGSRNVVAVVTLRDVIHGSLLLIPCDETEGVHALLNTGMQSVPERYGFRARYREGLVGVGTDEAWEKLEQRLSGETSRPGSERLSVFSALRNQSSLPHRLMVSLPERHRQELQHLWPDRLPEGLPLAFSPRQWVEDVDAVSLHWRLPPDVALELRVIPRDDGATERVAESLRQVAEFVAGMAELDSSAENDAPDAAPIVIQVGQREVTAEFAAEWLISLLDRRLVDAAREQRSAMNQLKQIGLDIHNFHDHYQFLLPRATVTPDGQGLLSWRVQLIPDTARVLFQQDEPWDGPTNRPLGEVMVPPLFVISGDQLPPGHTRIRFPVLEGSLWHGDGPPRTLADVTDGTSNTIAAAVAPPDKSVFWTNPEAWELDTDDLIGSFFGEAEETLVLMLDGSVRVLPRTIDPKTLRAMLTHAGGEVIP